MKERPLECSECKKNPSVIYEEVKGCDVTTYHMCSSCPILKQKLEGKPHQAQDARPQKEKQLCCCSCETSVDSILMGHSLGCSRCYEVFHDLVIDQLIALNRLPSNVRAMQKNKKKPLHVGRSPEIAHKELSSTRLSALNEALSDALQGENYEQAAWLRDQINALMDKTNEKTS